MLYFKTSQPVPGKGDALVLYECSDDQEVQRQLTYIPATGELEKVPDPVVTRLYRPEVLEESSKEEFESYWNGGE
jgi:hypothetical protein